MEKVFRKHSKEAMLELTTQHALQDKNSEPK